MAAFLFAIAALGSGSNAEVVNVRGDYVEVRTASVFGGACHYNGEVTTTGRDAVMAWNVTSGKWNSVDLAGVRAVAIVTSEANLADADAAHRSQIIVDASASAAQVVATVEALKMKYASALGTVAAVTTAPITFDHAQKSFQINAGTNVSIKVEAMPNDLCCKMPSLVWYSPLIALSNRKVGYTVTATYTGDGVGAPWQRSDENSAFYGSFSF